MHENTEETFIMDTLKVWRGALKLNKNVDGAHVQATSYLLLLLCRICQMIHFFSVN